MQQDIKGCKAAKPWEVLDLNHALSQVYCLGVIAAIFHARRKSPAG
jgi:hypothetical protein